MKINTKGGEEESSLLFGVGFGVELSSVMAIDWKFQIEFNFSTQIRLKKKLFSSFWFIVFISASSTKVFYISFCAGKHVSLRSMLRFTEIEFVDATEIFDCLTRDSFMS